ncbi:MAG: MerR family transcriptional regulator [Spirochaetes bacterium]|nr:MerR family transcriptional regulator [Spirochaetota bacterium]
MNIGNELSKDVSKNGDQQEYYTIGEVAKMTGVKPTVLRFWESEFSNLHPRKNKFGHRVYLATDIETILTIKKLLYEEGLTIKGAIQALENQSKKYQPYLTNIRSQLEEILQMIRERNRK